jgi:prepilin-type N-terminal cleavage/methylation domain-containing protein
MMMNFRIRRRAARSRAGFSLVEVMMAMTLLSIILLSLARITMTLSKRGRENGLVAKRTFALIKEANRFGAIPFDTLALARFKVDSTAVITDGDFTYTRRWNMLKHSNADTIKIVVTPSLDATRVDSVFVYRTKPAGSPLCVGC